MSKEASATFRVFAALSCVCCVCHFSVHLGAANFEHPAWWLASSIVAVACWTLFRFSLPKYFLFISLQIAHVWFDAPFNPDHWLLMLFINVLIAMSALRLRLRKKSIGEQALYESFAPAGRATFLICYGFAAFSKLNTHFLVADSSCARELAEFQSEISPWLSYVVVPSLAGWMTVVCECAVALLLLAPRTRRFGVMVGVLFHTVLVVSPAIAVFDFTVIVYTMLFLFCGQDVGKKLADMQQDFWQEIPDLRLLFNKAVSILLVAIPTVLILKSLHLARLEAVGVEAFKDYWISLVGQLVWTANIVIATTVIYCMLVTLFGKRATPSSPTKLSPQFGLQLVVLALAFINGACPYLGFKTQGSFTMFSNLRTEAGHWNHLIVPSSLRFVDQYQDDLVEVTKTSDVRIQKGFVDDGHLVPRFEIQRAAMLDPSLSISVVRNGKELSFNPVSLDSDLSRPLSLLAQKLLIFRPVTRDGSPYCGN